VFSARFTGESGDVMIIAPLPIEDSTESPLTFVAKILTLTLSPRLSEKGARASVARGTVH
jgi:hypothetical protein